MKGAFMNLPSSNAQQKVSKDIVASEAAALTKILKDKKDILNINQAKLALELGVKPPSINAYFKGKSTLDADMASFFAKKLEVNINDFSPRLAQAIGLLSGQILIQSYSYPVLEAHQIAQYEIITTQAKNNEPALEYISTNLKLSDHSFWMKLDNDDMQPPNGALGFHQGSLLLVDPQQKPNVNEFAILKITYNNHDQSIVNSDHQYVCRMVTHDGEHLVARPLNNNYSAIRMDGENIDLIGKVVSAMYPNSMFDV